jgi:hypothetical protein
MVLYQAKEWKKLSVTMNKNVKVVALGEG